MLRKYRPLHVCNTLGVHLILRMRGEVTTEVDASRSGTLEEGRSRYLGYKTEETIERECVVNLIFNSIG